MPTFLKSAVEKITVTKIPFLGFSLLITLPVLFPETLAWPLVFWIFYYVVWGFFWSWLLAGWMSFSFARSEQKIPLVSYNVVGRIFVHQVKLYALMLFVGMIVAVPTAVLLFKPMLGFASPEEIRALQIGFSGQGELTEPGISFFLRTVFILMVIPICVGMIVYMRCGFGMLALIQGSEKIGLIASWKRSKGTTLLAVKLFIPFLLITAIFTYLGSVIDSPGKAVNFIVQAVGTILLLPMFFELLVSYYRYLQSNDEE